MADNAIDKLFEEIRATRAEIDALIDEEEALDEQRRKLRQRHADALERRDLLDVTLRTHIYSKTPIVQAKMIAHEELSQARADVNGRMSTSQSSTLLPSLTSSNAQLVTVTARIGSNGRLRGSI